MAEFYPKDSVLVEESDGMRVFIPHVARKLSTADERLVQEALAEADALYAKRQRRLGSAAVRVASKKSAPS
jgi:hypothetical protein